MAIHKIISASVFAAAKKLAADWMTEFDLRKDHEYNLDGGHPWAVYKGAQPGNPHEIIIRRSFHGFWVELFKDGHPTRSVEVV